MGQCFAVLDIARGDLARPASARYLLIRTRALRSMDLDRFIIICVFSDARLRGCGFSMLNGMVTLHVRSRGVCPLMMAVTPKF